MPYFRVNNLKISDEELISRMMEVIPEDNTIVSERIGGKNIYKTNFLLGKYLEHTLGYIYIQSKSSMLSALALKPNENDYVLDLCSAPGSKTTLLAEMMNNRGIIIANEISLDRIKVLASNIDRLGITNTIISNYDGSYLSNFFYEYFDKILLDPPCTALGESRKTNPAIIQRNIKRLEDLTQIQFRLLVAAAKMLKVGGELVYSTCTTTFEENEYLIEKFLSRYPLEIVPHDLEGYEGNFRGKEVLPDLFNSIRIDETEDDEGFFIVKMKKIKSIPHNQEFVELEVQNRILDHDSKEIKPILSELSSNYGINKNFWENFLFLLRSNDLYFISKTNFDFHRLNFVRFGMKLASHDKKIGWRLSSSAVQIIKNAITQNILNLERKDQFVSYFFGHKTQVNFPDSNFVVVKYKNDFLGSGKVRDSILHSYFPKSRRTNEIDFSLIK